MMGSAEGGGGGVAVMRVRRDDIYREGEWSWGSDLG